MLGKVNHIESEESPSQEKDDKAGEEDFYINQMGVIKSLEEPEMVTINKDKIENSSGFIPLVGNSLVLLKAPLLHKVSSVL